MKHLVVTVVLVLCAVILAKEAAHQKAEQLCMEAYKTKTYDIKKGVLFCEKRPGHWQKP